MRNQCLTIVFSYQKIRYYPVVIQDHDEIEHYLDILKYIRIFFIAVLLPSSLIVSVLSSGKYQLADGSKVCLNLNGSICWNVWFPSLYVVYDTGGILHMVSPYHVAIFQRKQTHN